MLAQWPGVLIGIAIINVLLVAVRKVLLMIKDKTASTWDDNAVLIIDKLLWLIDLVGMNPDHQDAQPVNAKLTHKRSKHS